MKCYLLLFDDNMFILNLIGVKKVIKCVVGLCFRDVLKKMLVKYILLFYYVFLKFNIILKYIFDKLIVYKCFNVRKIKLLFKFK